MNYILAIYAVITIFTLVLWIILLIKNYKLLLELSNEKTPKLPLKVKVLAGLCLFIVNLTPVLSQIAFIRECLFYIQSKEKAAKVKEFDEEPVTIENILKMEDYMKSNGIK